MNYSHAPPNEQRINQFIMRQSHARGTNDEGIIGMRHLTSKEQINFVRHLEICYRVCLKLLQVMSGVIPSN